MCNFHWTGVDLLLVILTFLGLPVICSATSSVVPVVAILSQPLNSLPGSDTSNRNEEFHLMLQANAESYADRNKHSSSYYYIAASYVKWLESAGIRSIVLPYDASESLVEEIFGQVNGLLLPGGASALPPAARHMWELAVHSNEELSDHFPLWGTCLGFEFMVEMAAHGEGVVQHGFDAENVSLPLLFVDTEYKEEGHDDATVTRQLRGGHGGHEEAMAMREMGGGRGSVLFPPGSRIRRIVETQNVTLNNHRNGVQPDRFPSDIGLRSMFRIVSYNTDAHGRPFVSTIEPIDPSGRHPYYGVQFHPEKNMFENAFYPGTTIPYEDIDHSPDGIELSMHLSKFFGNLVRRNVEISAEMASMADGEHSSPLLGGQKRKKQKHGYTDPARHPQICNAYPQMAGVAFEQVYIVPGADEWAK